MLKGSLVGLSRWTTLTPRFCLPRGGGSGGEIISHAVAAVGLGLQCQVRNRGAPSRHMGRGYEFDFKNAKKLPAPRGLWPWDEAVMRERGFRPQNPYDVSLVSVLDEMYKLKKADKIVKQEIRKAFYEKPNQIKYRMSNSGARGKKLGEIRKQVEWINWGRKVGYIGHKSMKKKGKATQGGLPLIAPAPEGF